MKAGSPGHLTFTVGMGTLAIKNGWIINEGKRERADLIIANGLISDVVLEAKGVYDEVLDATDMYVMPGVIDDQVHFREPGLIHKADIFTESKAAVAGGITSYMEMPNTIPNAITTAILEEKYKRASEVSMANYSFYMGASNDNLSEILKINPQHICGVKIFMGSSTGNMLVDDRNTLENIFSRCPVLIATHCEDETTIRHNLEKFKSENPKGLTAAMHPLIRPAEACYLSSSLAVALAKKHNSRLHILHVSTLDETALFENDIPLSQKRITSEVCVHHLWFTSDDYRAKGNMIKWNPAVKDPQHRDALWQALLDDRLDVIATDHAPHTLEEKQKPYEQAPSGGPLVQHALMSMMEWARKGKITPEKVVEKMCHAPAICFRIQNRGFIRQHYAADVVLFDPNRIHTVSANHIYYKCGWSPFEGLTFSGSVYATLVNGQVAWKNGRFNQSVRGERLSFHSKL